MAYVTKSPTLLVGSLTGQGANIWYHTSADATAAFDADGFITDAKDLGMKIHDVVLHKDSTSAATALTSHKVIAINTNGSADLSDGTVVGSATDSD